MSDSEHDDEFEAYLKRRVPIDKGTSQLEHLEPPPELDRIVIGKARKAIQGAAPIHVYRAPKWALPVGLAATILISFAILLDLGVRAKRNDASVHAELNQMSAHSAPTAAEKEHSTVTPASNATVAAAEPEPTADRARTRFARAEKAAKRARPEVETAAAAPTVASTAAAAPVTSSAAAAAPIQSDSGPASSHNAESKPASATADNSQAAGTQPDPAAWLARIEKLRDSGRTAEAEGEMQRFRATYPDYPVPKPNP